jgi:hypothetical protein
MDSKVSLLSKHTMSTIIRTAVLKAIGGLLAIGQHVAEMVEVAFTTAKESTKWVDKTPQVKIVYKNETGQVTAWMNCRGYKNISDFPNGIAPKGHEFRSFDEDSEKFLVDKKTNMRVESPERTEQLLQNIDRVAISAGVVEEGEDYDFNDLPNLLVGESVGIKVIENKRGKIEVSFAMPVKDVKSTVAATQE